MKNSIWLRIAGFALVAAEIVLTKLLNGTVFSPLWWAEKLAALVLLAAGVFLIVYGFAQARKEKKGAAPAKAGALMLGSGIYIALLSYVLDDVRTGIATLSPLWWTSLGFEAVTLAGGIVLIVMGCIIWNKKSPQTPKKQT